MAKFDDSITINCSLLEVRDLLADLQRHPAYVPDGFKNYRFLSRETRGQGARAAVQLNLLGHWLSGELEVAEATDQRVVLKAIVEPANLELDFHLVNRGGRTEVRMSSSFTRRMLPPWRLRTRIKQRLRLEQDVAGLVGRFLSLLKSAAEVSPAAAEASSAKAGAKAKAAPAEASSPGAGADTKASAEAAAGPDSEYVAAGAEADLGPGQARVIKVGGRDVAVFNIAGEFHAISNSCPHRGGPLGFGTLDGSVVTCPLHGFRFDVTTGQCPDVESLRVPRFELRRANGQLQVRNTPITA